MNSSVKQITSGVNTIACELCLKEMPETEASISKAEDYIAHFCGLESYEP